MGVLKRTMERAPTKPRDSANEDFTTEITKRVVRQITGRTNPRSLRRKRFCARRLKCQHKIKESKMHSRKFQSSESRETSGGIIKSVILFIVIVS